MSTNLIQPNNYYILRNNKLLETEFGDIKENEVFLYNGSVSQDMYDLLIVFGYKKMNKTNVIEVHHSYDAINFRLKNSVEKKLVELSKILF